MAEFKDRLRIALNNKNMKPIELAEKVNCSRSLISQYLSGKCKAKQDLIYVMALELEVKPTWLMGYDSLPLAEEKALTKTEIIINYIDKLTESEKEQLCNVMIAMFPNRR